MAQTEDVAPPILYRVEDAARMLSVSRARVFELIAAGALQSVLIGRSRRVSSDALRRFVEDLEAAAELTPA